MRPARAAVQTAEGPSPTTSIRAVLVTFSVGLVLAVVFGARGLVHAGKGMEPGLERDVTLSIGEPLLAVTQFLHVTDPWDAAESALGRAPDSTDSPLLSATSSSPQPTPVGASDPAKSASPTPQPTAAPKAIRIPTAAHPLRLLVTGDSLTEYIGPQLVNLATQLEPVTAWSDTHYGTGIVRPDFVDWAAVARQQIAHYKPEAVVVFIGGNDDQNITMPDGRIVQVASPAWTREYERRVAVCMRQWVSGTGRRVYWLSMPPARDNAWSAANRRINVALRRAAAQVPGARFLDVLGPLTDHGRYTDSVLVGGVQTYVRTPDGIHFNSEGSNIVAHEVLETLRREWHLGARKTVQKRRPTPATTPATG